MKILAFEFSSAQRSVAVRHPDAAGGVRAQSEVVDTAPGHAMKPIAMIETALRDAGLTRREIEAIAIGLGPGSYTGIRAGLALAQGWQLGLAVKLAGVSTALALAHEALVAGILGPVAVVIDAQRGEFYIEEFELGALTVEARAPLRIVTPAEVTARSSAGVPLVGPGITKWFPGAKDLFPRAAVIASLAVSRPAADDGHPLEPIYLRESTFAKAPPPRVLPP